MKKTAIALCLCFVVGLAGGCSGGTNEIVLKTPGYSIDKGTFNFYLISSIRGLMENNGISTIEEFDSYMIAGQKAIDVAVENTFQSLMDLCAVEKEFDDLGMTLSAEDEQNVDDYLSQLQENIGGADAYREGLKSMGMTPESYRDYQISNLKASLVYDKYMGEGAETEVTEEQVKADFEANKDYYIDNYVRVKHILAFTVNPSTLEPLSDEEKTQAREKIERILEDVKNGADFDKLALEENEDTGASAFPDGYVFTKGEMDPNFESTSFALQVGQVSDIIESSWGYHIIKRYDLLEGTLLYDTVKDKIEQNMKADIFNGLVSEWIAGMTFERNEEAVSAIDYKVYFSAEG
jgi:foldase protein PrsA